MTNQYISSPLLTKESPILSSKTEQIKKLQQKNDRLKTQLIKIQQAIHERFLQLQQQSAPKKRESIFQHQQNYQVLSKQLANAYKRVKMYEYEVGKLEEPTGQGGTLTQRRVQFQQVIKEKRVMAEKLKIKLTKMKRESVENIRRLEKMSHREEVQADTKKITEEANFYKEKLKKLQESEQIKSLNMKKQFDAIKKIENQLLQQGTSGGQIEEMKRIAVNSVKVNPGRKMEGSSRTLKDENLLSGSEQQVQDHTREFYEAILGETELLQKMNNDYQKQMIRAFQEKIEAINISMESRRRLLQCENEIDRLESELRLLKTKVVPSNLKPTRPLRSVSSQHVVQNSAKLAPIPAKYVNPLRAKQDRSKVKSHSYAGQLNHIQ